MCEKILMSILTNDFHFSGINAVIRRLGGAFGGKVSRNNFVSCAAALAAVKLRKPVKLWLPLEDNLRVMGKRLPLYVTYEVGVNDRGVVQYLDADLYSDYGVVGNEVMDFLLGPAFENSYDYSTWNYTTYMVHTDTPSNTWTRSPCNLHHHNNLQFILLYLITLFCIFLQNIFLRYVEYVISFYDKFAFWI